ncbi:MAG: hypothetical protein AAFR34_10895, partial [Pseudomonadota bacterium]
MQTVAAVTMVRDDAFFLKAWLRHYGQMFGRENCYVVNHGRGAEVAQLAEGCNIFGIPGDPHKNFDVKQWLPSPWCAMMRFSSKRGCATTVRCSAARIAMSSITDAAPRWRSL